LARAAFVEHRVDEARKSDFSSLTRDQLLNLVIELERVIAGLEMKWKPLDDGAYDQHQKIFVTHDGSINLCHWVPVNESFAYAGGSWPRDKVFGYVDLPEFRKSKHR
jgi:hypothetical protein